MLEGCFRMVEGKMFLIRIHQTWRLLSRFSRADGGKRRADLSNVSGISAWIVLKICHNVLLGLQRGCY